MLLMLFQQKEEMGWSSLSCTNLFPASASSHLLAATNVSNQFKSPRLPFQVCFSDVVCVLLNSTSFSLQYNDTLFLIDMLFELIV